MLWIRSNTETARHPKVENLADTLNICTAQAIGHLHMLWWWATEYAPDGDLSAFSNRKIARAAGWEGNADEFVKALVGCGTRGGGFLDPKEGGGYELHNWEERMGGQFKERVHNAERNRRYRERKREASRYGYRDASRDGGQDKTNVTENTGGVGGYSLPDLPCPFPLSPTPQGADAPRADALTPTSTSTDGVSDLEISESKQEASEAPEEAEPKRKAIPKATAVERPIDGAPYDALALECLCAMYELVPGYEPDPMREIRLVQDLVAQYPEKNIGAEFARALGWCKDKPEKARRKKNLRQFLRNWVSRASPDPERLFVTAPDSRILTAQGGITNGGGCHADANAES